MVGMRERRREGAHEDLGLGAWHDEDISRGGHRGRRGHGRQLNLARGHAAKDPLDLGDNFRRLHVAAHRQDHLPGHVVSLVVGEERRAVEFLDALGPSERVPRVRVRAEERRAHLV